MLVFFIRHAETVDNIAGVYAGVTDSELTNHGIQQARNLGNWLAENRPPVCTVFASPLQRTRRTANAVLDAQKARHGESQKPARLVTSPLLIEQDFGSFEKTSYHALPADTHKMRREAHADRHRDEPGFVDVESRESMARRCDEFLESLLLPAITAEDPNDGKLILVVSHGILLSHLWRRFLLRLPRKSVTIAPEVTAARGQIVLEHLGGWSNTGVLEIRIARNTAKASAPPPNAAFEEVMANTAQSSTPSTPKMAAREHAAAEDVVPTPPANNQSPLKTRPASATLLSAYTVDILAINAQHHLKGVKRARGGIGSAKYDEGQKSLDSFFKRAKK